MFQELLTFQSGYNSCIWSPSYAVHSDRIERIQKIFLYQLSYANNSCNILPSNEHRLQCLFVLLGIYYARHRVQRFNINFLVYLVNKYLPNVFLHRNEFDSKSLFKVVWWTRREGNELRISKCRGVASPSAYIAKSHVISVSAVILCTICVRIPIVQVLVHES